MKYRVVIMEIEDNEDKNGYISERKKEIYSQDFPFVRVSSVAKMLNMEPGETITLECKELEKQNEPNQ